MKRFFFTITWILFFCFTLLLIIVSCYRTSEGKAGKAKDHNLNLQSELHDKVQAAYQEGNYQEAIKFYESLRSQFEQSGIKGENYATLLNTIAECYSELGDYSQAIVICSEALNIRKKVLGEKSPDYALSLSDLSTYYSDIGNYPKAIELGEKALEIRTKILGENNPYYATSLYNLASIYADMGDYLKAIEFENRELKIVREVIGEENYEYSASLSNLSTYYSEIGNYPKALELGIQALEIFKKRLGEKHPDYATSLDNLSVYYSKLGDYSKAIELGIKGLEIRKEVLGEKHPAYATSLSNLGSYYYTLGDYSEAFRFENQALGIFKNALGEEHPHYIKALTNLADCYYNIGNYSEAIDLGMKALELKKSIWGEKHPDYASSLSCLANYCSKFGDDTTAIDLGIQVLEIRKEVLGGNHPDYITSLNNLACYYANIGDYFTAIDIGCQVLKTRDAILGENHPDYAISYHNLANYYSEACDYDKAIDSFQKYINLFYFHILSQLGGLTENLRSAYWKMYISGFTDKYPALMYLSSSGSIAGLFDKSALFAKGLLLTTEIEINKLIQESGDEEALNMFEELKQKRLMLQKLYEKPIAERVLNTDSLEQEADKLEGELIKRSQVYGDFSRKLRTTWKDVQAALNEDEMAVEFLSFGVGTDSTMVVALTLRKDDKEPKMIPLFEQKQMEKVKDIKFSRDRSVRKTKTFYSQEVTDLVWKPMAEELKGIKRIYFSAAGILHKVGIEYAPGMEDYDIYRLSTTREVIDMKENSRKSLTAQSDAVLYGGVDYEALAKSKAQKDEDDISSSISIDLHHAFIDSLKVRRTDLKYLPGTLDEVKHISSCFDQKHRRTITGTDATETSVKFLPEKLPRILHIATHGFYYTEKEKARMDVRKGLLLDNERENAGRHEDEALTRSGLYMAGANKTLKGEPLPMEADDGILTAQEIAKIDLRGVDLVVLSACETGQGDINQGEGVYGLQRGFKKAGVNTIMMSLWKVSDKATEILMTEFYRQVCAGKNTHESLRMAQKKVREYKSPEGKQPFEDPFFWAGFILLD